MAAGSCVCLDSQQNQIGCTDPDCTFGDCNQPECSGVTAGAGQTGSCLDAQNNQVTCGDPECTYGDCIDLGSPAKAASTTGSIAVSNSNGPTALSTFLTSATQAAGTAYAATVAPTSTVRVGTASLSAPQNTTTIILLAVVAIVAFLLLKK